MGGRRKKLDPDSTFAEVFAKAAAGRPQTLLATQLGVSQSKVSRWLSGRTLPDEEMIPRLAEFLGTTEEDLAVFLYRNREQKDDARRSTTEQLRRYSALMEEVLRRLGALEEAVERIDRSRRSGRNGRTAPPKNGTRS